MNNNNNKMSRKIWNFMILMIIIAITGLIINYYNNLNSSRSDNSYSFLKSIINFFFDNYSFIAFFQILMFILCKALM
jgi:cytochrome b subunit of formate dehydrogenase